MTPIVVNVREKEKVGEDKLPRGTGFGRWARRADRLRGQIRVVCRIWACPQIGGRVRGLG